MIKDLIKTEESITNLIDKYSSMILKVAFLYVKNISDAEDITQEVFEKLFTSNKKFKDEEHIKAWLIVITKNKAIDLLKSSWFKKRSEMKESNMVYYDKVVGGNEVLKAIISLDVKYKDVIYMYYYEGYSTKEISEKLNQKEATIRTRLKRAREKLKIKIGGDICA